MGKDREGAWLSSLSRGLVGVHPARIRSAGWLSAGTPSWPALYSCWKGFQLSGSRQIKRRSRCRCRDKAQRAERCGPARSSLSPQEAGPACDAWRGRGDVPGCSVRRERVTSRSRCPWCADGQRRLAPGGANGSLCSALCVLPTSRRSPLCVHHSRWQGSLGVISPTRIQVPTDRKSDFSAPAASPVPGSGPGPGVWAERASAGLSPPRRGRAMRPFSQDALAKED